MSKVLVTGASGLIGSRIIRTLAERGMDVVGTARSSSEKLCQELGVPVRQLDVLSPHSNALAGLQAECLIHCATANDIVSKVPAHGMNLTVNGTWNVLELARTLGISRFIFFSTFQVFGTELSGIVDESRPPCCESAYGLNHWFGEEVCRMFASKYPMDIAAVRPSNVYGAPLASSVHRESLVPTCFVQSAIRSGEIVLQSSGRNAAISFQQKKWLKDVPTWWITFHGGLRLSTFARHTTLRYARLRKSPRKCSSSVSTDHCRYILARQILCVGTSLQRDPSSGFSGTLLNIQLNRCERR